MAKGGLFTATQMIQGGPSAVPRMVWGDQVYSISAIDGPGEPLLGGTTYGMTGPPRVRVRVKVYN